MTSDEILDLKELPGSLLIMGGGYIGCEFATVFSELGTKVTIVEMLERLVPMSDKDISSTLAKIFKARGIELNLGIAVEKMEVRGKQVVTTLKGGQVITTDKAVICTGRGPVSKELGCEAAGVKVERGFIQIDQACRTSVENIYAIGDVTGKLQLAHVASRQGHVAVENILGHRASEDYKLVPSAIYTHPEIGAVGLTEEQAKEQGLKVRSRKFNMVASGIATAYGATEGFVKIIADEDDVVVGAFIMCPHASDIIHELAVLIKCECTLHELIATIHGHPTFSEAVRDTAEKLLGL